MKMCSIASGSSGNCIYIANEDTHILVDVGISKKRIVEGLKGIGVDASEIDAILITHEHSDHISGLGVMSRAFGIPIYGTKETLDAVAHYKPVGAIDSELFRPILPDTEFNINSLKINPFSTSHDAANPVCYTVASDGKKVAVATDLGEYNEYIVSHLEDLDMVLIEANYDKNMLQVGPYPYYLKQRILGTKGHLSNENSGQLLRTIFSNKLRYIMLGHLSKENNYPELAYQAVKVEIQEALNNNVKLSVAHRDRPTELVTL